MGNKKKIKCDKCDKLLTEVSNFCPKCGEEISTGVKNQFNGNYVDFGKDNKVFDNTINIHQTILERDEPEVKRKSVKPMMFFGKTIKVLWLMVSGFVSFVSGFLSIGSSSFVIFIITMFAAIGGLILFFSGLMLSTGGKYISLPPFLYLEVNSKGEVCRTKLEGECIKCGSKLSLAYLSVDKDKKKKVLRCERNPDHCWDFDSTKLPNL